MRVGVIGFGAMGQRHVRVISKLKDFSFVGFFDPRVQVAIDSVDVDPSYWSPSLDELISRSPDYVVIATPTSTHFELFSKFSLEGIPSLIEKPLCVSKSESELMIEVAESNNLKAGVGHIERFNPAIRTTKRLIESGVIGEVVSIDTFRKGPSPNRDLGVGVKLDLLSHDVDTTMWLLGEDYVKSRESSIFLPGSNFEDFCFFHANTSSGILIRHQVDWISPVKIRQTRIQGLNGMILADTLSNSVTVFEQISGTPRQRVLDSDPGEMEPLELEHIHFRDLVAGKASDVATLNEAAKVIEIITLSQSSSLIN